MEMPFALKDAAPMRIISVSPFVNWETIAVYWGKKAEYGQRMRDLFKDSEEEKQAGCILQQYMQNGNRA